MEKWRVSGNKNTLNLQDAESWNVYVVHLFNVFLIIPMYYFRLVCTTIAKKFVRVNSRFWSRKELWGSSSSSNLLLLASPLQNINDRFIILPPPYTLFL